MQESARAALSYVRSRAEALGLEKTFFDKSDIHLHIPAGAQPKDGPSAGVTMATALVSLISGRSVRPDVGMTGEITLRGQVLPVGGIKEKILAARRAGVKIVILPFRNKVDVENLPPDVKDGLEIVLTDRMEEIVDKVLLR